MKPKRHTAPVAVEEAPVDANSPSAAPVVLSPSGPGQDLRQALHLLLPLLPTHGHRTLRELVDLFPWAAPSTQPSTVPSPSPFVDFKGLVAHVPYRPRVLRDLVQQGVLPSIRVGSGRKKLMFHLPSCDRALLAHQVGGV